MNTEKHVRNVIGAEYVHGAFQDENGGNVRAAYQAISAVNRELFKRIPLIVDFSDLDPYASAKEMREHATATGRVTIYTGYSGHPFLDEEANSIGRAVHDVFAHMVCGCPFSFAGEYNAYLEQRRYYPAWTWDVLFAEIPAQTAAFYYSGGFTYSQRAFSAPQHWQELCMPLQRDYSANSIIKPEVMSYA
jgi:hypothetical protein